jgi:hypothetical protein
MKEKVLNSTNALGDVIEQVPNEEFDTYAKDAGMTQT